MQLWYAPLGGHCWQKIPDTLGTRKVEYRARPSCARRERASWAERQNRWTAYTLCMAPVGESSSGRGPPLTKCHLVTGDASCEQTAPARSGLQQAVHFCWASGRASCPLHLCSPSSRKCCRRLTDRQSLFPCPLKAAAAGCCCSRCCT